MTTTTTAGETVRGFFVIFHNRKGRALRYPCSGQPPMTGEAALACMRELHKRGFSPVAFTTSQYGGDEQLDLAEMSDLYAS